MWRYDLSCLTPYCYIDLDNLVKFVLDALNGKAYEDDSQVCEIHTAKLYTDTDSRTEVVISKLLDSDVIRYSE